MPEFESQFYNFAAILMIAAAVGGMGVFLRQPLIVTFIAVGILVGPAGLGITAAGDEIALLAKMGIALLLFLVGLRLDFQVIRTMGPVALATGLGQVLFTSVFGLFICLALGLSTVAALFTAVALTFSSTIIIVKLLSDKREIDALHGRIAVGFLIVQDIMVVVAMIGLSAYGTAGRDGDPLADALLIFLHGVLFLSAIGLLMKFVLPPLVHRLARSQELLILSAIAWAMFLAAVGDYLGFSKEVGAFLAGVSLASTPFRESISGRLVSLRDFLLLFFFIELGAGLDLSLIGAQLVPATVLSLFVLVGNPMIVMVIMGVMGYRKRTSFLAGLTVAQISEFSLILGALGVSLGHLSGDTMGLITLVGLITIGLSTYMILYSHPIYERIAPLLSIFERRVPHRELGDDTVECKGADFLLFGLGRFGNNMAHFLRQSGASVLGVDFDPQVIADWHKQGHAAQYGDAEDPELAASLPLPHVRWVVCTAPQQETSLTLLHSLREHGYTGKIAVTAHHAHAVAQLRKAGADRVLLPFVDAAKEAAESLLAVSRNSPHQAVNPTGANSSRVPPV
jgi:Kef-type K+ transport system membrane component KefB